MDAYVEDRDVLLNEVFDNLQQIQQQQTATLNEDLLRRAERALDASTPRELLWRLLQTGEGLIQSLSQDPRPLTKVLERVVLLIPFDELKHVITPEKLEEGLKSPSVPIQLLCLAYLTKAADTPSGASFIAASSPLAQCLVTTWLSVDSTEVSERSLEALVALLAVDSPDSTTVVSAGDQLGGAQGQGLLWRRIFYDPQVYILFFLWTSLKWSNYELGSKKGLRQATISQARLLDFLARISLLDWSTIITSTLPDVEEDFVDAGADKQPYGGLLRYAASDMIDSKDFLMEVLRQEFFLKLLKVAQEENSRQMPPRLLQAIQEEVGDDANGGEAAGVHL